MAAAYRESMMSGARPPVPAAQQPHSPWHSPVPYLFGGLAAMLGLIAFALLILACSYWKLSGYLEDNVGEGERDLEAGRGKGGDQTQKTRPAYEEKFLVILAGQQKPTCLATPMWSSRSSTFGDNSSNYICSCNNSDKPLEMAGTVKQGSDRDQLQNDNGENRETSNQNH